MTLREKYKWAIDLIKAHCGEAKVFVKEFDWGHGLSVALEHGGKTTGLLLQRPKLKRDEDGEIQKCVGLYQLTDTEKTRQCIIDWVRGFLNKD